MAADASSNDPISKLFRDDPEGRRHPSPFPDDEAGPTTPNARLRRAIVRLRQIRSQAGSDGLTPSATRSLLDEIVRALEAIADARPDTKGPTS